MEATPAQIFCIEKRKGIEIQQRTYENQINLSKIQ